MGCVYGRIQIVSWVSGDHISTIERGKDVVLMWEMQTGIEFALGRFELVRGEGVFVTSRKTQERLAILGLDPWEPDFFNYAPLRAKKYDI